MSGSLCKEYYGFNSRDNLNQRLKKLARAEQIHNGMFKQESISGAGGVGGCKNITTTEKSGY